MKRTTKSAAEKPDETIGGSITEAQIRGTPQAIIRGPLVVFEIGGPLPQAKPMTD